LFIRTDGFRRSYAESESDKLAFLNGTPINLMVDDPDRLDLKIGESGAAAFHRLCQGFIAQTAHKAIEKG
jgi:hypothetical protein